MVTYTDYEVMEWFEALAKTSSILKKKELIKERALEQNTRTFLDYLLNPYFVTGISIKKIHKKLKPELVWGAEPFRSFHDLMTYVRKNHTGSDEILGRVQKFIIEMEDPRLAEFYILILTKSLRIGCEAKTINNVFGFDLIPIWEVQQAYQINNATLSENEWFSLSQKLNGVRGTFYEGKLISRQGKEFSGLEHIINDIRELIPDYDDYVLDGELIRKNTDNISDNENFRLTAGIINQEDADKSSIQFIIFDILPKKEFLKGESKLTYRKRFDKLMEYSTLISILELKSIDVVDILYTGTDQSQIEVCLDKMVAEGKEGVMLNRDTKYMRKRNKGILKIKRFYTVDLKIIDFEEGAGRLSGMLGAFIVRYKNNILHVGSGMTDEQRRIFWEERENLIDRVIEVKYKEESRDKDTGKLSLQFPIFVQLRELGKEESYD